MKSLTDKQKIVLDFIKSHIESSGFPPTRAEIANGLGFASPNASQDHLVALEKKGFISIAPKISRGLRLTI